MGSNPTLSATLANGQSGEILYRTFRGDGQHLWAKRVVQGLQGLLFQIDITEIWTFGNMCDLSDPFDFCQKLANRRMHTDGLRELSSFLTIYALVLRSFLVEK